MRGVQRLRWLMGLGLGLFGCATRAPMDSENPGYHVSAWPLGARPIGDAAPAFARYLVEMHKRVHPLFTDRFLVWADQRPLGDPIQNHNLSATIELVLDGKTGRILRRGIVRSSNVTLFDVQAMSSIERAAPFGPAPEEIRSVDGNVHLQWELRRDTMACSVQGTHPFLLGATTP